MATSHQMGASGSSSSSSSCLMSSSSHAMTSGGVQAGVPPGGGQTQYGRQAKDGGLGPPDVYPQDPHQKEDDLSQVHVKQVTI